MLHEEVAVKFTLNSTCIVHKLWCKMQICVAARQATTAPASCAHQPPQGRNRLTTVTRLHCTRNSSQAVKLLFVGRRVADRTLHCACMHQQLQGRHKPTTATKLQWTRNISQTAVLLFAGQLAERTPHCARVHQQPSPPQHWPVLSAHPALLHTAPAPLQGHPGALPQV